MKRTVAVGLFISLLSTIASATPRDPLGSVGRVLDDSKQLERAVGFSNINYSAKDATYAFVDRVYALADCVQYNGGYPGLSEIGCPQRCARPLNDARNAFRNVQDYLGGTQNQFPEVYRAFSNTRHALNSVYVGQPSPQPQMVRCVATDSGWEEHAGGHPAYGYGAAEAQRLALRACGQYHGRCRIASCR